MLTLNPSLNQHTYRSRYENRLWESQLVRHDMSPEDQVQLYHFCQPPSRNRRNRSTIFFSSSPARKNLRCSAANADFNTKFLSSGSSISTRKPSEEFSRVDVVDLSDRNMRLMKSALFCLPQGHFSRRKNLLPKKFASSP